MLPPAMVKPTGGPKRMLTGAEGATLGWEGEGYLKNIILLLSFFLAFWNVGCVYGVGWGGW